MALQDLFSYRERMASGNTPDVYVHDNLPQKLRVQVILIWRDAVNRNNRQAWEAIHNGVAREHGTFELVSCHI